MKYAFEIGNRTLHFPAKSKKEATQKANNWQANHPEHTGVTFIGTVAEQKGVKNTRLVGLHKF